VKFLAIKFLVESIPPSSHGILQTGEHHSAFSAVQVSRGNRHPATHTLPTSSLSPQPQSAAAVTVVTAAMATSTSSTSSFTTLSSSVVECNVVFVPLLSQITETPHFEQNYSDLPQDNFLGDHNVGNAGEINGLFRNHTGEGNYTVYEFSIQQNVMHFLGDRIDQRNRMNVETCLLIEAGMSVSNERATTSEIWKKVLLDRYVNLVCQFESDHFVFSTLKEEITMKIYSGMKHMTGDQLWRKFEDWMKEM